LEFIRGLLALPGVKASTLSMWEDHIELRLSDAWPACEPPSTVSATPNSQQLAAHTNTTTASVEERPAQPWRQIWTFLFGLFGGFVLGWVLVLGALLLSGIVVIGP
jgi:hypothetical protein